MTKKRKKGSEETEARASADGSDASSESELSDRLTPDTPRATVAFGGETGAPLSPLTPPDKEQQAAVVEESGDESPITPVSVASPVGVESPSTQSPSLADEKNGLQTPEAEVSLFTNASTPCLDELVFTANGQSLSTAPEPLSPSRRAEAESSEPANSPISTTASPSHSVDSKTERIMASIESVCHPAEPDWLTAPVTPPTPTFPLATELESDKTEVALSSPCTVTEVKIGGAEEQPYLDLSREMSNDDGSDLDDTEQVAPKEHAMADSSLLSQTSTPAPPVDKPVITPCSTPQTAEQRPRAVVLPRIVAGTLARLQAPSGVHSHVPTIPAVPMPASSVDPYPIFVGDLPSGTLRRSQRRARLNAAVTARKIAARAYSISAYDSVDTEDDVALIAESVRAAAERSEIVTADMLDAVSSDQVEAQKAALVALSRANTLRQELATATSKRDSLEVRLAALREDTKAILERVNREGGVDGPSSSARTPTQLRQSLLEKRIHAAVAKSRELEAEETELQEEVDKLSREYTESESFLEDVTSDDDAEVVEGLREAVKTAEAALNEKKEALDTLQKRHEQKAQLIAKMEQEKQGLGGSGGEGGGAATALMAELRRARDAEAAQRVAILNAEKLVKDLEAEVAQLEYDAEVKHDVAQIVAVPITPCLPTNRISSPPSAYLGRSITGEQPSGSAPPKVVGLGDAGAKSSASVPPKTEKRQSLYGPRLSDVKFFSEPTKPPPKAAKRRDSPTSRPKNKPDVTAKQMDKTAVEKPVAPAKKAAKTECETAPAKKGAKTECETAPAKKGAKTECETGRSAKDSLNACAQALRFDGRSFWPGLPVEHCNTNFARVAARQSDVYSNTNVRVMHPTDYEILSVVLMSVEKAYKINESDLFKGAPQGNKKTWLFRVPDKLAILCYWLRFVRQSLSSVKADGPKVTCPLFSPDWLTMGKFVDYARSHSLLKRYSTFKPVNLFKLLLDTDLLVLFTKSTAANKCDDAALSRILLNSGPKGVYDHFTTDNADRIGVRERELLRRCAHGECWQQLLNELKARYRQLELDPSARILARTEAKVKREKRKADSTEASTPPSAKQPKKSTAGVTQTTGRDEPPSSLPPPPPPSASAPKPATDAAASGSRSPSPCADGFLQYSNGDFEPLSQTTERIINETPFYATDKDKCAAAMKPPTDSSGTEFRTWAATQEFDVGVCCGASVLACRNKLMSGLKSIYRSPKLVTHLVERRSVDVIGRECGLKWAIDDIRLQPDYVRFDDGVTAVALICERPSHGCSTAFWVVGIYLREVLRPELSVEFLRFCGTELRENAQTSLASWFCDTTAPGMSKACKCQQSSGGSGCLFRVGCRARLLPNGKFHCSQRDVPKPKKLALRRNSSVTEAKLLEPIGRITERVTDVFALMAPTGYACMTHLEDAGPCRLGPNSPFTTVVIGVDAAQHLGRGRNESINSVSATAFLLDPAVHVGPELYLANLQMVSGSSKRDGRANREGVSFKVENGSVFIGPMRMLVYGLRQLDERDDTCPSLVVLNFSQAQGLVHDNHGKG